MKQPVNELILVSIKNCRIQIKQDFGSKIFLVDIAKGGTPLSAYKAALKRLQRLTRECEREIGRLGG